MADWLTNKGAGPWEFAKQGDKSSYNEGHEIATANNPVWNAEPKNTLTPITPTHIPCGYWNNKKEVCTCDGLSIGYTKTEMSEGDTQTLTALGAVTGCTYHWGIVSGDGTISADSGTSVTFTFGTTATVIRLGVGTSWCDTLSVEPLYTFYGIYACVSTAVYRQDVGDDSFDQLQIGSDYWTGLCAAPSGNIYMCGASKDIFMQTNGTGDFVGLNQTHRNWSDMCATPNGDIYATVFGGGLYKQTGGVGDFEDTGIQGRRSVTSDTDGNIYLGYLNGIIFKVVNGVAVRYAEDLQNIYSMCITQSNDLYYGNNKADAIFKQTNLTGEFVEQEHGDAMQKQWDGMGSTPNGDVYACTSLNPRIYKQTGGIGAFEAINSDYLLWSGLGGYL